MHLYVGTLQFPVNGTGPNKLDYVAPGSYPFQVSVTRGANGFIDLCPGDATCKAINDAIAAKKKASPTFYTIYAGAPTTTTGPTTSSPTFSLQAAPLFYILHTGSCGLVN